MEIKWKSGVVAMATVLALAMVPQVSAARSSEATPIIVAYDMGGSLQARQDRLRKMRRNGQPVEIRGQCYSACTMYLGLRNVCVAPDALLGFHGPRGLTGRLATDVFDHWSQVMARDLRPPLHDWFMTRARYVTSGVVKVSGASLINMGYARCDAPA